MYPLPSLCRAFPIPKGGPEQGTQSLGSKEKGSLGPE
jgi:hypothetical protein